MFQVFILEENGKIEQFILLTLKLAYNYFFLRNAIICLWKPLNENL